ncbi:MAG: histidine phosphatase family protein [Acidimicrobiales bacterium]|nr:histidine phosphatase family protein [Acidimicrobiales bacterium]
MLIVVRHGRTEANASGLLLGRNDPGLDELGRLQAGTLAAAVAGSRRVVCSPLRRTRETAAAIGLPVEVDERWIELDYGALDGVPMSEVPADLWSRWTSDLTFAPEDGESIAALGERVRAACEDLAEEAATHDVVVVTHVSPVKAAVAWALGVGDEVAWRMFVAPASITRLSTSGPRRSLHGFNQITHLT